MKKESRDLLEIFKNEYISKSNEDKAYSYETIVEIFEETIIIFAKIEVVRDDKYLTIKILKDVLSVYHDIDRQLLELWLVQALAVDDSYVYAYNYIAQKINREMDMVLCEIKDVTKYSLFKMLEQEKSAQSRRIINEVPQCLYDIWIDCDNKQQTYDRIINKLKGDNVFLSTSFITEVDGKLIWNESIRGNRQYLAAFIYTITKGGWINNWYSSSIYKRILENTFLFKNGFKPEMFKHLSSQPFDDKYLIPFKGFPIYPAP